LTGYLINHVEAGIYQQEKKVSQQQNETNLNSKVVVVPIDSPNRTIGGEYLSLAPQTDTSFPSKPKLVLFCTN